MDFVTIYSTNLAVPMRRDADDALRARSQTEGAEGEERHPDAAQVNFDLLPLEHIDRVELLSGTASLLGPYSLGGAENLMTRHPQGDPEGEVELAGGSYRSYAGRASHGGRAANGWSYYAGAGYSDEEGWRQLTGANQLHGLLNLGRLGPRAGARLQAFAANGYAETAGSLPLSVYDVKPDSNLSSGDFEDINQLQKLIYDHLEKVVDRFEDVANRINGVDNEWLTPEQAKRGGLNPKMFNSFLDGSKPSIESTAVANATGLTVPSDGLLYPPASVEDIPFVTRPISEGGVLERKGMVEVISSLEANGRKIPYDIRMGVWVTVEAETEYIKNCFEEYNAHTDPSGRYFTLYKRWHLIGLEVGMSVASVTLRGEPTGVATGWNADVVATAKRDLAPGDVLDGEGGYTVWGKLLPAEASVRMGGLPLGLAHGIKLVRAVKQGHSLCWADVAMDTATHAYRIRRELEHAFAPAQLRAA